jgi:hypothetical protein
MTKKDYSEASSATAVANNVCANDEDMAAEIQVNDSSFAQRTQICSMR